MAAGGVMVAWLVSLMLGVVSWLMLWPSVEVAWKMLGDKRSCGAVVDVVDAEDGCTGGVGRRRGVCWEDGVAVRTAVGLLAGCDSSLIGSALTGGKAGKAGLASPFRRS
jgi:hypothetical protein